MPARSDSLQQLRVATQADDELAILKHTIMQGWPKTIKQVPPELQPYWTFREELTIEDGLILKGTRIVIPNKQHQARLKQLHEGHLGLNKCRKICADCEKPVLQSKRGRPGLIQVFDGVLQYPIIKQPTITYANTCKQISKV